MDTAQPLAFGTLLRRYRIAAGLTQEELAAHAAVSRRSISDMERAAPHTPRKDTVRLLVEALALAGAERAVFELAARRAGTYRPPPPPPGTDVARTNVPRALASFIGREAEQAAVQRLLREARLLTLTGTGGCGKTRLALEVAAGLVDAYPDGVWLVELAALADPARLPQAVGAVLGVMEQPGQPLTVTVRAYLQPRRMLLVLDNCEHLVAACAALATALLPICPHLVLLATSRERLEVAGERTYPVPPLAVPDPGDLPPLERLLGYDAVQLFLQRAQARRPEVALTGANAAAVAQICARLDGLPLAIELAAARVSALPVEEIAGRLADRFRLLTGGPRATLPRQQTMRATLDWSWALLGGQEQTLLRRLSVFAGGWTLDAAEAVCTAPLAPAPPPALHGGREVEAWDLVDRLSGLVEKSLVELEEWDGATRHRLLETVRQYGQEKLAAAGELAALRGRHLTWYLALAERAARFRGPAQAAWLGRLEAEHDNLRAALHWARESGQVALGVRLAGALGWFWWMHGHLSEGRGWLEGLLAQAENDGAVPAAMRAAAVSWAGVLAGSQGDYGHAAALHQESLALYQTIGDTGGSAVALHNLGVVAQHQGDFGRAVCLLEESVALRRDSGEPAGRAESLRLLGLIASWQGDYGRAEALLAESLALYRALEDRHGVAGVLGSLGWPAKYRGNFAHAEALSAESLALYRDLGDKQGSATVLRNLGAIAREQGDFGRAAVLSAESLALARELGSKRDIATALTDLARVAHYQGAYELAEALLAESLALYRGLGSNWGIAFALHALGAVAQSQGDQTRAAWFYKESLRRYWADGEKHCIGLCLEGLADVACTQGQWHYVARLLGVAAALREAIGAPLPPIDRAGYEGSVGEARTMLGAEGFRAEWAAGQALPLKQAIAEALEMRGAGRFASFSG